MRAQTGRSACENKLTYDTPEDAQAHLDALKLQEPFKGQHIYRCNNCGKWHVAGEPRHAYGKETHPRHGRERRLTNE
jgi:hypothetical protein